MSTKKQTSASDLERVVPPSLRHWQSPIEEEQREPKLGCNVTVGMGWGRLIFAHTFKNMEELARALCQEAADERDIAFYLPDPHVVLSYAPDQLFLDPSHTFRLWFHQDQHLEPAGAGFTIREVQTVNDAKALNRIYAANGMMTAPPAFILACRDSEVVRHIVAVDDISGEVIGTVTGVDHERAFADPEKGSSLWCLAVAPEAPYPGIGRAMVEHVAREFRQLGRSFIDLSVMHDNAAAIHLYEKLGFVRVPVFTIKRKNPINEPLFTAPDPNHGLNPYARIIIKEARRRGIKVDVTDEEIGLFCLTWGGRTIRCRESLTDLTTAVTMTCCDDKRVTRRILQKAGLSVPAQQKAASEEENCAFLKTSNSIVVKPARGEQGHGISVDVRTAEDMQAAVSKASIVSEDVVLEQYVEGYDLRLVVIDYEVVAAALRLQPEVIGNGEHTIRKLIEKQSRRRAAATGGESRIPLDDETERCVRLAGYALDDVLPEGESIQVRKTANLHTGGVLQDVTAELHPQLAQAAVAAASALEIPVVGMDFIVRDHRRPDYVVIEANERPGLANHEPQPTAERFIDLLFPQTVQQPVASPNTASAKESHG